MFTQYTDTQSNYQCQTTDHVQLLFMQSG